jgi:hypothetical protein
MEPDMGPDLQQLLFDLPPTSTDNFGASKKQWRRSRKVATRGHSDLDVISDAMDRLFTWSSSKRSVHVSTIRCSVKVSAFISPDLASI